MLTSLLIRFEELRLLARSTRRFQPDYSTQALALEQFAEARASGRIEIIEVACPVCGNVDSKLISNVDRQGIDVETVRCLNCPTLYSRKRMTEESLEIFYSEFYRQLYGGVMSPNLEWFEQQSANGSRILETLTARKLISSAPSRVLEIGTGAGGALLPFWKRGDEVVGIDFDERFLDFGRSFGLALYRGGFELLSELGTFDIVILKDVLEHLPNPRDSLSQIAQHLSPRGVVYVQVPGLQELGKLGYRYDLLRYLQIAHVCHFTVESLTYLGQTVGLAAKHVDISGKVVFSRDATDSQRQALTVPSPKIAEDALKRIYLRRIPHALRRLVMYFVPESLKRLLRRCRDARDAQRR